MWKMEKIILFGVLLSDSCYLLSDACVFVVLIAGYKNGEIFLRNNL